MSLDLDKRVEVLEANCASLKAIREFAPRAFVIEFAGTPKAGKTTSVEAIRHFFSRQGFSVHVLVERASVCPIPMKGHLFFNTWCATSMLAELLATVDTETDIIIVDRGIFDALVWLTLQLKRGEITVGEAQTFEKFILLERWRQLIDLAVVMNVPAIKAIERENSQRISKRAGSIMNEEVVAAISSSVSESVEKFSCEFRAVVEHGPENDSEDIRASNVRLAEKIVHSFADFLSPEILVVPRVEIDKLPITEGGCFGDSARAALLECLSGAGTFMRRKDAENNFDYVQIVACGLFMQEENVFLMNRKDKDPKSALFGSNTIWQGCHVAKRDEPDAIELLKFRLSERISRTLFLGPGFGISFAGYCWTPDAGTPQDQKSKIHLGVVFHVNIDNPHTVANLKKKEYRRGRGFGLAGRIVKWDELQKAEIFDSLESWSKVISRNLKLASVGD
jgi:predicted NUDIX family phosphoesterase